MFIKINGAGGGTRTHTAIRPPDFKSGMSTIPSRPHMTLLGNPTKHLKPKIRYLHLLLPAGRLYRAKRAQKAKDCSSMLLAVAI